MWSTPGTWPAGILGTLAHVEHVSFDLGRLDQPSAGQRQPGVSPGGGAAGQLTDDVVVPDLVALAHQLGAVLVGADDEQQRPLAVDEPPQPRCELVAQRDGQRPGNVACSPGGDRSGVEDLCAVLDMAVKRGQLERREGRLRHAQQVRSVTVHLTQVVK